MHSPQQRFENLPFSQSLHTRRDRWLRRGDLVIQVLGVAAVVLLHGLRDASTAVRIELGLFLIAGLGYLTLSVGLRLRWTLARDSFVKENRVPLLVGIGWGAGMLAALLFGPLLPAVDDWSPRFTATTTISEVAILVRGVAGTIVVIRRATAGATDPTVILVTSFVVLIAVGTALLMLPRAKAPATERFPDESAPFLVALFTSTSASCVTGLVVVPTGTYWSPFGQAVIFGLFQVGGLGIMTCGAFFALAAGGGMQFRESATLRDLLESEQLGDVRRLVLSILVFTLASELIGAVLISGLWADLPLGRRIWYSLFHSVSAFCNAGFSLTDNSFVGMGNRWQVWGGVAGLIVIGGMGFAVLYNFALCLRSRLSSVTFRPLFNLPRNRVRLTLSTKLASVTTLCLLIAGTAGYFVLEAAAKPDLAADVPTRTAEAWFQSVTFRTAGFNTVDHGSLHPSTKLFAILLMFIGASPGSTGGGVKTVCFAVTVLALLSILRGRPQVEIAGRTIPQELVNKALAIFCLGVVVVMTATLLLVLFENQPALFIDHMYEATSAFGTVGVSTGVTPSLTDASKTVIIVTMFIGRVGPLTLLIALAGRQRGARYEFPAERVTLG
jgi:trk/ktr system potassium uptake protein